MTDEHEIKQGITHNVALYPWFMLLQNLIFWMPVFFLFFASKFTVSQVLVLESIYYAVVVFMEVPSGYFSDRIGRRITLIGSALCWVLGGLVFYFGSSFFWFGCAQALVAAGMALRSGSDSSLLFESLKLLGRETEIAEHESRAQTMAMLGLAVASVVGGLVATIAIELPYLLFSVAALLAAIVATKFSEPATPTLSDENSFAVNMKLVLNTRTDTVLMWMLGYSVALTVLIHIPYEMLQPYVRFTTSAHSAAQVAFDSTPAIAGVMLAVTMLVGAWASVIAVPLCRYLGVGGVLFVATGLVSVIIFSMTVMVHWAVLPVLLLRSLPFGIATPIMNSVIHRRLPSAIRATYFSMHSLLGRLAFSVVLLMAATLVAHQALTVELMHLMLVGFSVLTIVLLPFLLIGTCRLNVALNEDEL